MSNRIHRDVIIVGGGPAGSSCAWKLKQAGIDCAIFDKQVFPRTKLCAGWITPKVIRSLELDIDEYPHSLTSFDRLHFHAYGGRLAPKTKQYAIRRSEFDAWLLERSGTPVLNHEVRKIERVGEKFIIDGEFECSYLVGAGGTFCPVYTTFFKERNPRKKTALIAALEKEFEYDYNDSNCYLWFFENDLPGYSWYVPKRNGYINIGAGGVLETMKQRNRNIKEHWDLLISKLKNSSLIDDRELNPKGHNYYVRRSGIEGQVGNCYIVGDAAGLATKDMGEGIGPAIESGILSANSIVYGKRYSLESIPKYSLPEIIKSRWADVWMSR